MSSFDIADLILDHLGITTLVIYGQAAKSVLYQVRIHINRRLHTILARTGIAPDIMLQLLSDSHSVISGSTVLSFMLPYGERTWTPKDLDLYTNKAGYTCVISALAHHGYSINKVYTGYTAGNSQHDTTPEAIGFGIDRVINMRNTLDHSIDVIISVDKSPFIPIFNFHSTALMNFISGKGFFCAYPRLTSSQMSVVNPLGFPGLDTPTARIQACIQKYEERGFRFIYPYTSGPLCSLIGCYSDSCIDPVRHTQDGQCLYFRFSNGVGESTQEHVRTYIRGYNIKWCLGAKSCDPSFDDAYSYARMSRRL